MPLHEICILVSGGARSSEGWQKKSRSLPYEAEEEKEEEEEEVEEEGRLKWYFASRRIKNEERTRKGEVWWDGEGMILEKEEEEQEETEEDKTVPPPRAKITLKSSSKRFKGLRSGRQGLSKKYPIALLHDPAPTGPVTDKKQGASSRGPKK
ncbi:hypothetical protein HZH68_000724 [Vespula germanica]|uniref:Uncharacterized protein n=1 Tax=Vespula germanica TaxID=30212 RepID=A0A834NUF0_VESGE|nr:hypothetical protein HZH68_000724 [Vespula germanica]